MPVNRTIAPKLKMVEQLDLPKAVRHEIGDIPVYITNMGTQPVFRLEIVFEAGRYYEAKPLVSRTTSRLMREGSKRFSGEAIAEQLDFFGSSISAPVNLDYSSVLVYGLRKHFAPIVEIVADVLLHPTFPTEEFESYLDDRLHKLQLDLSKTDAVAYRTVTEAIFGSNHPYGYNSNDEYYRNISRADLNKHHENHFVTGNCKVFLAGQVGTAELAALDKVLLSKMPKGKTTHAQLSVQPFENKKIHIHKPKAQQTAIRIGRRLFSKKHADYAGLYVLNTILGGYFGSRLMANIREDKGYTYNIYSMLDGMRYDGSWIIGTEVGNDVVADTITQIYFEMDRLQKEWIPEEELQMVKNYLLGNLLNTIDGPFNVSEVHRTIAVENLSTDFFVKIVETVKQISAEDIRQLAIKYLDPNDFYEVVVGVIKT